MSNFLGIPTLSLLIGSPEACWRFAHRIQAIAPEIPTARPGEVEGWAYLREDWARMILAADKDPVFYEIAVRIWDSGQIVLSDSDLERAQDAAGKWLYPNGLSEVTDRHRSEFRFAARVLLACVGLAHASRKRTEETRGSVIVLGETAEAIEGLLYAAFGDGGGLGGFIRFIASFMPDHLVRGIGTQIMGGTGGSPFLDQIMDAGQIHVIEISYGDLIEGIHTRWRNARNIQDVLQGQQHGGNGPHRASISFHEGERLIRVSGRAGQSIDQLSFHTTMRDYGPYGGNGGSPFEILPEWGAHILGFQGRAGAMIDAIGGISEVYGSAQAGGMGGIPFLDALPTDGRIARITLRAGGYLDSIQITHDVGGDGASECAMAAGADRNTASTSAPAKSSPASGASAAPMSTESISTLSTPPPAPRASNISAVTAASASSICACRRASA